MFRNNHYRITKPRTESIILEGDILGGQFINLPNGQVLFMSKNGTNIKKFSHDLKKIILEKTLEGQNDLLGVLPDGSLLINHCIGNTNYLVKMCSRTFKTIFTSVWDRAFSVGILNNNSFFVIECEGQYSSNQYTNVYPQLIIYQLDKEKLIKKKQIKLDKMHLEIDQIKSLGENAYACHVKYTSEYFIFKIDPQNDTLYCQIISPRSFDSQCKLTHSVVEPKGELIIYDKTCGEAQVWDIPYNAKKTVDNNTNRVCYEFAKAFSGIPSFEILPFPDGRYLLLKNETEMHIFDHVDSSIRKIQIECLIPGKHHILPNGQLLAFVKKGVNFFQVKCLDLIDLLPYKKAVDSYSHSYYFCHHFFQNTLGLPKEISQQITSYAFTPEDKTEFLRNVTISEKNKIEYELFAEQHKKCLMM